MKGKLLFKFILLISIHFAFNILVEKCINSTNKTYYPNSLDNYLFSNHAPMKASYDPLNYGDKVQIINEGVYLNSNQKDCSRSLIKKGNDTTWKYGSIYIPIEYQVSCEEKFYCSIQDTKVKTCNKCILWKMISDMEQCRRDLIRNRGELDKVSFNELCSQYSEIRVPKNSVFRKMYTWKNWDFDLISPIYLISLKKTQLSDCPSEYQSFVCFNLEGENVPVYYVYDSNNQFKIEGRVSSRLVPDALFEDSYKKIKLHSPITINIAGKQFFVINYTSMYWIDNFYLDDCSNIKPLPSSSIEPIPVNPLNSNIIKPIDEGLNGIMLAVIIVSSLVMVGLLIFFGYKIYNKYCSPRLSLLYDT